MYNFTFWHVKELEIYFMQKEKKKKKSSKHSESYG
jgi:hypothetical protein